MAELKKHITDETNGLINHCNDAGDSLCEKLILDSIGREVSCFPAVFFINRQPRFFQKAVL